MLMIAARGARDLNPILELFVALRCSQEGHFMAGTCDLSLFQVNIRAALAAICRLHSFRFPLEVVAAGAPNLDPRFCSHSELLSLQYHPRDSFPLLEMVCLRRISLLERIIGWRARRVESNCLKETARGASLFCVVTRKVTYNINGPTARGWSSVGCKFEHSGREGLRARYKSTSLACIDHKF